MAPFAAPPLLPSAPTAPPPAAADGACLCAWTTTPWTLPSNLALCVNADFEYVKVRRAGWARGLCWGGPPLLWLWLLVVVVPRVGAALLAGSFA